MHGDRRRRGPMVCNAIGLFIDDVPGPNFHAVSGGLSHPPGQRTNCYTLPRLNGPIVIFLSPEEQAYASFLFRLLIHQYPVSRSSTFHLLVPFQLLFGPEFYPCIKPESSLSPSYCFIFLITRQSASATSCDTSLKRGHGQEEEE